MARIIRIKLTAALALAGVLQKMNNNIVQLGLEDGMDGIVHLAGELVDTSFQLQQNPDKLKRMEDRLGRMEYILTEGRLVHDQTAGWERMFRVAKLEEIKAQFREAQALVMAYRELPETLVLKRPVVTGKSVAGHPTRTTTGASATL